MFSAMMKNRTCKIGIVCDVDVVVVVADGDWVPRGHREILFLVRFVSYVPTIMVLRLRLPETENFALLRPGL